MKMTFIDTSGFASLFDDKLDLRDRVVESIKQAASSGGVVTTDYVLDELFTWMRCKEKMPTTDVSKFIKDMNVSNIEIVGITKELFQEALFMMGKYSDQYFSFTDCVSFAVMKEMGIEDFIGMDNHFSTAGFNNLLKA